jgi:hypothetical protein
MLIRQALISALKTYVPSEATTITRNGDSLRQTFNVAFTRYNSITI